MFGDSGFVVVIGDFGFGMSGDFGFFGGSGRRRGFNW